MADIFTSAKRSAVMSLIRSRGNQGTELRLISLMRKHRITGWRRGVRLPGSPDFVFRKQKVAIFVDGCFWHGCPRHGRFPDSRQDYWGPKLSRNAKRDRTITRELRGLGWKVLRIWECNLTRSRAERTANRLIRSLAS
jgi:DNA mismatch endonuclease (patch repair protein)